MTFSSKHAPSAPDDSPPITDDLTDHEIAVQMKLVSERNKNDKCVGSAARRIYRSTGDWPWVWLKDILPETWSFAIIENLGTLMNYDDLDEVKAFLHDAVERRSGNVLKLSDIKRARRHFALVVSSQAGNNNGAPTDDERYNDEHSNRCFSDEDDATSGEGVAIKRRRLNKPVASNNHLDSEFKVEEDATFVVTARTSARNSRSPSPKQCSTTRKPTERKTTSTVTSTSRFIKKVLRIVRAAAFAADEKLVDNHAAIAATREAITLHTICLAGLDAAAETTNPLTTSLEDATAARKAIEDGKAAFERNLVAMNMDEEVAEVVRRNYTEKLAAAEGKIDDIDKHMEAEKLASANALSYRAGLEYKIEEGELELAKLRSLGEQYGNEVKFWVSIRNMVSLEPEGMKRFLYVMKSQGMSLYEVMQHQGD
ncbi:hypothetical protein FAVG1_08425 [Fusarium avenaceum]|nr:hypothetical protein FAVG1_08425 [Fusarium avenaceum]